jgi:hypothetical protein
MDLDVMIANETLSIEGTEYRFAELTGIDETNINHEFTVQASRYAYLAALTAKAEALFNEAKLYREETYAEVELMYRDELAKTEVKTTESMIRSYVTMDEKYSAALHAENQAQRDWKTLRALVDGMKMKSEMLISLASNLRQEYSMTNMHLNETKDIIRQRRGDV